MSFYSRRIGRSKFGVVFLLFGLFVGLNGLVVTSRFSAAGGDVSHSGLDAAAFQLGKTAQMTHPHKIEREGVQQGARSDLF